MEKENKITKQTLIPIGLVIVIIAAISSILVWTTALKTKTEIYYMQVSSNTDKIKEMPSRLEFSAMQEDVKEIRGDVKKLLAR